jgi:hypothetical protein
LGFEEDLGGFCFGPFGFYNIKKKVISLLNERL